MCVYIYAVNFTKFRKMTASSKHMTKGHEQPPPPDWWLSNVLLGKSREIAPERMQLLGQRRKKKKKTQLWMGLMVKVKSSVVRNKIA